MNMQQRLDALNSLKVIETSASAGELEYVLIENSPENYAKLLEIGVPQERIDEGTWDEESIDIAVIGFESGADWFDTRLGGFITEDQKKERETA